MLVIDGIQLQSLLIIFIIYAIFMIAFIWRKKNLGILNFIVVFFDTIMIVSGINVLYYAFTKDILFEALPGTTDYLIALVGLIMIVIGLQKFYNSIKKKSDKWTS
jgi:hypothetical protein